MIVYLAGNITDNDNYKKEFKQAEKKLKEKGHIVLNPAKLPKGMAKEQYMPICLAMIEQADWLVTINDKKSDGVKIEKKYADYQSIPVMSLEKCLSVPSLEEILNGISNIGKKFNDALDCGCKE